MLVLGLTDVPRRSATLRSYAGDTSLPGGKAEEQDRNIEDTAVWLSLSTLGRCLPRLFSEERLSKKYTRIFPISFRSLFLELISDQIGLSLDKQKVPLLCILEPFLAGNQLIVTP